MRKTVNILGTEYKIYFDEYEDFADFAKRGCNGICDDMAKEIHICRSITHPATAPDGEDYCNKLDKEIARHEVIHAFLNESGLKESAHSSASWAHNEEMVDWIAIQFTKIMTAFAQLDLL